MHFLCDLVDKGTIVVTTEVPVSRICLAQWPGTHLSALMDGLTSSGTEGTVVSTGSRPLPVYSTQGCFTCLSAIYITKRHAYKDRITNRGRTDFSLLASPMKAVKQLSLGLEQRLSPMPFFVFKSTPLSLLCNFPPI